MDAGATSPDAREAVRLADVDPSRAGPVAAQALRGARRAGDLRTAAVSERAWGRALWQCGDVEDAVRHLRRSVGYADRAGEPTLAAEARMPLAAALVQRGRPRQALIEIDLAITSLDGPAAARARAQRADVLHQTGRLDAALAEYQTAVPQLRRGDPIWLQRALVNRGILHTEQHSFGPAEADLREAERLAETLGRRLATGIIAENLGFMETLRGDLPAALAHLSRAEQTIGAHAGQLGPVFQDRAELLLSAGVLGEARLAAERAIAAYHRDRRQLLVPGARLLLAQAAYLGGDWPVALEQARVAMRELRRQGRSEWAALAELALWRAGLASGAALRRGGDVDAMVATLAGAGWPAATLEARIVAARLALRRGRDVEARAHLTQAGASARRRGPAALRARGWYATALLRLHTDDERGALRAARTALGVLDGHSASLGASDLRAHAALHRVELTELGLRIALRDGRPARVLEWAERGRASQLLRRPVRPPDDPHLAQLLSELRATATEIDRLRGTGRIPARLAQRQVVLEREIRDHSRLHRGATTDPLPPPVSPARLGSVLGDRALVEYVALDGTLFACTVVDGRARLRTLGPVAAAADLMDRVPFALLRLARWGGGGSAAALTLLRQAAAALDALLVKPLPELEERPLVVVPTGPLHSMAWSVLPSCAGRPVTVSPSATLWHATSGRVAEPARQVIVASGPELPGARDEARAVAAIHGATALEDGAATADAVLTGLAVAGLAHLASHGRLSADNPLFSELRFADGPLVVYDIERLPRVPHTVVLAACDSGRSVVHTGDELLGLGAAFIARGATHLVASVVPVPDAETAPLMIAFHRRLAAGEPAPAALAAAQRELADGRPESQAAAAGFVCLGSGGRPAR